MSKFNSTLAYDSELERHTHPRKQFSSFARFKYVLHPRPIDSTECTPGAIKKASTSYLRRTNINFVTDSDPVQVQVQLEQMTIVRTYSCYLVQRLEPPVRLPNYEGATAVKECKKKDGV